MLNPVEIEEYLKKHLTLTTSVKNNWGNPILTIKLELTSDVPYSENVTISSVDVYASDLKIEE